MAQRATQRQINGHHGTKCGMCGSHFHNDGDCPLHTDDEAAISEDEFFRGTRLCGLCLEYGHNDEECQLSIETQGMEADKGKGKRLARTKEDGNIDDVRSSESEDAPYMIHRV